MTLAKFLAIAHALILCLAALPSMTLAKTADKLVLDQNSETALLVMKTVGWEPAPMMQSAFRLSLSGYEPTEERLLGGPFSGRLFEAKKKNFVDGYLIIPIKPGRWIFVDYSEQDNWALCFNAGSWQFDVKAGQVLFLGRFDSLLHHQQLVQEVVRAGKVSISRYAFADFFDLSDSPRFDPVDEGQLNAVQEMLRQRAPLVTAPLIAANFSPAKFGTGSTLFAERRCGGYFSTSAKSKDSAQQH